MNPDERMAVIRRRAHRPRPAFDLLQVFGGAFLAAVGFNLFLRANGIVSGGLTGVSLLVNRATGFEPAYTLWGLNTVILFACGLRLGRSFVIRSALGSALVPLFVFLTRSWVPPTQNLLLAAVCGGTCLGFGLGLVFRGNSSAGGFTAIALTLHRVAGLSVDRTLIVLDGVVTTAAFLFFPPDQVLCGYVCVVVTGRMARATLTGFNTSRVAWIISQKSEDISRGILDRIPLGVTKLEGEGGYTGSSVTVLLVVLRPSEVVRLKALVRAIDPSAFMILGDAAEVLGYGFRPHE